MTPAQATIVAAHLSSARIQLDRAVRHCDLPAIRAQIDQAIIATTQSAHLVADHQSTAPKTGHA